MSHIDAELQTRIRENPDARFQIIVRVEGDMDARQAQLEAEGLEITRRLWLIRGFAGAARGKTINALLDYEWILSIEFDQPVHTM
jgi:hypothetical protein